MSFCTTNTGDVVLRHIDVTVTCNQKLIWLWLTFRE